MGLQLKTAASIDPVTLAEAKQWLERTESDHADRDSQITDLIAGATELVQDAWNRQLITATWELFLDGFFNDEDRFFVGGCIFLRMPPFQSITSIKHIDTDGNEQTIASSVYALDAADDSGRIALKFNQSWPATRIQPESVTVEYKAGYGDAASDVPSSAKTCIKMIVLSWWNREASVGTLTERIRDLLLQKKVA